MKALSVSKSGFLWWHFFWLIPATCILTYEFLQDIPRGQDRGRLAPFLQGAMPPYLNASEVQSIHFSKFKDDKILINSDVSPEVWDVKKKQVDFKQHEIRCGRISADETFVLGYIYGKNRIVQAGIWNVANKEGFNILTEFSVDQLEEDRCPVFLSPQATHAAVLISSKEDPARQQLEIWQVSLNQNLRTQKLFLQDVKKILFSSSGSKILIIQSATAKLLDTNTGGVLVQFENSMLTSMDRIVDGLFSSDEKFLTLMSKTGKAWVFKTKQPRPLFPLQSFDSDHLKMILPSQGESLLLTYSENKDGRVLRLWDMVTGDSKMLLKEMISTIEVMAFSQDNHMLAVGTRQGFVKLWDIKQQAWVGSWKVHDGPVVALDFSATTPLLVSLDADGVIRTFDAQTGNIQFTTETQLYAVPKLLFSQNGKQGMGFYPDHLWLWDGASQRLSQRITAEKADKMIAAQPLNSPQSFVALGRNHCLYQSEEENHATSCNKILREFDSFRRAAFSKDHTKIAVADSVKFGVYSVQNREAWVEESPKSAWITAIAFAPDGKSIITGNASGEIYHWDLEDEAHFMNPVRVGRHSQKILELCFSSSGKKWISAGRDRVAKVWDFASQEELFEVQVYGRGFAYQCAFSPDEQEFLMIVSDYGWDEMFPFYGKVQVWDASSGHSILIIEEPYDSLGAAMFSPDGKEIWTTQQKAIGIHRWDAHQGIRTWIWNTHLD